MAVFVYRAVDAAGRVTKGEVPALNLRDLEARLRNGGMELLQAQERRARAGLFSARKVPARELITFCFHMEQTLRGGVLVTDALVDLVESVQHPAFRDLLSSLLEDVREGATLSKAMRGFPHVFDDVFIGLVAAGESSGGLHESFARLGASLRWRDELNAQMKKMMMYPLFTGSVITCVTVFMLLYLVPQLAGFIKSSTEGPLPLQTQLLLAMSDGLKNYWWAVLAAVALGVAGFWLLLHTASEALRMRFDRLKLRIPVIGPVVEKIVLVRVISLLGMLYAAGVPMIEALRVARSAAGNRWVAQGIQQVEAEIVQGHSLSAAFQRAALFPVMVLRMIRIGETTGELDKSLENVGYFYNRDIQEKIGRVQALVEPVMTVALGLILGWLMISVLGPIYDLLSKMKV